MATTDRELIESAAKACGLPECGWMGPAFMYVKDNTFTDWNPLENDGDALRLAVKLEIDLCFGANYVIADGEQQPTVNNANDPCAAVRYAIVRAAAAMAA